MKINKITRQELRTINKKQILNQNKPTQEQSLNKNTPCEPKYYQAINNINFMGNEYFLAIPKLNRKREISSIKTILPQASGKQVFYEIDDKASIDLLLTQDGEIDSEAMEFFAKVYRNLYSKSIEEYKSSKRDIEKVIKESQQNFLHVVEEGETCPQKENNGSIWSYALSQIEDDEERIDVARYHLENMGEKFEKSEYYIGKEAEMILKLSKTPNGIDKSNMGRKKDIAIMLASTVESNLDEIMNRFIKESETEKGKVDLTLLEDALTILVSNGYNEDEEDGEIVSICINTAKEIDKKSKFKKEEAFYAFCNFLSKGAFAVTDEQALDCFFNCYNPIYGDFEEKGVTLLDRLFKSIGQWIAASHTENIDYNSESFTFRFKDPAYRMIDEYFDLARDNKTGKIKKEEEIGISVEDFISIESEKYGNSSPFRLLPSK